MTETKDAVRLWNENEQLKEKLKTQPEIIQKLKESLKEIQTKTAHMKKIE
jgi:hypothetical protein